MKKASQYSLLLVTCAFSVFLLGIFLGRSTAFNVLERTSDSSETHTIPNELVIYSKEIYINGKLNINAAGKNDFALLPGIGDVLSDRIIAYRDENGYFADIEDLLLVEGMGDGKLHRIKDYITVGGRK